MKLEFYYFKKDKQYYPVIDIVLRGPTNKTIHLKALVDSGASFSVFRPEVAHYLGISLEKGKKIYLTGIGGKILGYLHTLSITIGKKTFMCKIVFSLEFNVSLNLLGRDNFFTPFVISFIEKKRKIVIESD